MKRTYKEEMTNAVELLIDNLPGDVLVRAMSSQTTREYVIKALDIDEIFKYRMDEIRRLFAGENT